MTNYRRIPKKSVLFVAYFSETVFHPPHNSSFCYFHMSIHLLVVAYVCLAEEILYLASFNCTIIIITLFWKIGGRRDRHMSIRNGKKSRQVGRVHRNHYQWKEPPCTADYSTWNPCWGPLKISTQQRTPYIPETLTEVVQASVMFITIYPTYSKKHQSSEYICHKYSDPYYMGQRHEKLKRGHTSFRFSHN